MALDRAFCNSAVLIVLTFTVMEFCRTFVEACAASVRRRIGAASRLCCLDPVVFVFHIGFCIEKFIVCQILNRSFFAFFKCRYTF